MKELVLFSVCAVLLSSCVNTTPVPVVTPPPVPPETTLSTSVSSVTLAVSGTPRTFAITNTGSKTATSVAYRLSRAAPSGTTLAPTDCGSLAPSDTCTITITPGGVATHGAGDASATPISISVSGSNSTSVDVALRVLTYGSVHQSGYVFAIDDTPGAAQSIAGKVVAMADQNVGPTSLVSGVPPNWGGLGTDVGASVDEDSAVGVNDGAANTAAVVTALGVAASFGRTCNQLNDGGYTDWYLPAICEWLPFTAGSVACTSPTENIYERLFLQSVAGFVSGGYYASSTQDSTNPANAIWLMSFDAAPGPAVTYRGSKILRLGSRCARRFTN